MSNDKTTDDVRVTAPLNPVLAKAAIPVDPFLHKRHYEGGHCFNFPISHYELRTEEKVKQDLIDGGDDQVDKDMEIIREALAFHKTTFGAKIEKE